MREVRRVGQGSRGGSDRTKIGGGGARSGDDTHSGGGGSVRGGAGGGHAPPRRCAQLTHKGGDDGRYRGVMCMQALGGAVYTLLLGLV